MTIEEYINHNMDPEGRADCRALFECLREDGYRVVKLEPAPFIASRKLDEAGDLTYLHAITEELS